MRGAKFSKENLLNQIVFQFPVETAKGFWIIGLAFVFVSRAKIFQDHKIQSVEENVSRKKLLKVIKGYKKFHEK